ncbi:2-hydroxyacid dehydrogenase [Nocardioides aequoreus]|uniref:2-hydroxyacid dehydrogenase n=1 Tax=Nocardioides aequoreus TaxID=397278 RepID=UPI0004C4252A|nr:2-hydroxyacid dehydrogenase [Nocardioides aequoreus]
MADRDDDRLVWVPFDPADLGEVPDGLRVEQVDLQGEDVPDDVDQVRFLVMDYRFGGRERHLFDRMTRLEVIQTQTAGVEHVSAAVPEGVTLCNGRGIHDTSTAELALTLTLASLRGIPDYVRAQDRAEWAFDHRASLADKRVLIVGYGQIGEAIERRVLPFEATVTRVARSARDGVHAIDELPGLLPDADVVVLIVPGTQQTTGLFDAEMLARMKDGALLVNVSRGPVVDTDALLTELRSGRLRAALDVVDPEPLPADHPLWEAPGLLVSPHVGGASDAMKPRAMRLVREQLERYAAGEQLANVMTGDY